MTWNFFGFGKYIFSGIGWFDIYSIIDSFFPTANYHAQESNLINQYSQLQNSETKAYINISTSNMLMTILKSGKLLFNNSFVFSTKEDLLYYTLFCFEQLKLSADNIAVEYALIT